MFHNTHISLIFNIIIKMINYWRSFLIKFKSTITSKFSQRFSWNVKCSVSCVSYSTKELWGERRFHLPPTCLLLTMPKLMKRHQTWKIRVWFYSEKLLGEKNKKQMIHQLKLCIYCQMSINPVQSILFALKYSNAFCHLPIFEILEIIFLKSFQTFFFYSLSMNVCCALSGAHAL